MENQEVLNSQKNVSVVSVGNWVVTLLITAIPIVNIILLFVWAFSDSTPVSKANWAKATLIWFAVALFIWLFVLIVSWGAIGALMLSSVN